MLPSLASGMIRRALPRAVAVAGPPRDRPSALAALDARTPALADTRRSISLLWAELSSVHRLAMVALLAFAFALFATGMWVEVQANRQEPAAVVVRAAFGGSLVLLAGCIVLLLIGASRLNGRQRAIAEARAREFELLSATADAVATSLEPARLFATLEKIVAAGLRLDGFRIVAQGETIPGTAFSAPLHGGDYLVAERGTPLCPEEERVIRAIGHSLEAGLANASLVAETARAAAERQLLLRRVALAHEEERRRLVGDLHDVVASDLIRILYAVRRLQLVRNDESVQVGPAMETIERMVEDAEKGLRRYMATIRPAALDVADLPIAIRSVANRFRDASGLNLRVRIQGGAAVALHSTAQIVLVRALEEALLNVQKHARATRVGISLIARDGHVILAVGDDGQGWPSDLRHEPGRGIGLEYLRERVGSIGGRARIGKSRLGGARIEVHVPARVAA